MNYTIILYVILLVLIYTLFYTFINDFGMFLFIIILLLTGMYVYGFIEDKITIIHQKIDNVIGKINSLKDDLISVIH